MTRKKKTPKKFFYVALAVGSCASVLTPIYTDHLYKYAEAIERFGVLLILVAIIISLLEAVREGHVQQDKKNRIFSRRLRILEDRMANSEKIQTETLKIATETLKRLNDKL